MSRFLGALFMLAMGAFGQTSTGSIIGTVVDPTDLPVAGARVLLQNAVTSAVREAATDERGAFIFGSLAPGEYNLSVTAGGFKRVEKTGLNLTAAETLATGRLALAIGEPTESITVEAQGSALQTATAERAGVVTRDQMETMVNIDRDPLLLTSLMPGVVGEGVAVNVQGNRDRTNNVSIEGMPMSNFGNSNSSTITMAMDAVAEMKVLLTNYQAEYGRGSGANIVLVPRGGTRRFHGLASYFKRNESFNANNFFNNWLGTPRSRDRFNLFTYSIGGPVYIPRKFNQDRSKLFFYWLQEYQPTSSGGTGSITVPTAAERAGDFSNSLDLNGRMITVRDPVTKLAFPGNQIPASRLDPNGVALLKVFPDPNFFNRAMSLGTYNYIFQYNTDKPSRKDTLRLDYNLRPQDQLAFTYAGFQSFNEGALGLATSYNANWPQLHRKYTYRGGAYTGRYTRILSPTLVNELNIGFARRPQTEEYKDEEVARYERQKVGFTAGQMNPVGNPLNLIPNATFGGVSNAATLNEGGGGRFPFEQRVNYYTLTENLTKIWNTHTLKAGGTYDFVANRTTFSLSRFGTFDFASNALNPLNTNYAYSNAAIGVFNTYREATNAPIQHIWQQNLEWFVQDNWKVSRRLTFDYGVRFYWIKPVYDRDNVLTGFNPAYWDESKKVQLIGPTLVNGTRMGKNPVTGAVVEAALIGSIAPGSGNSANGMVRAGQGGYPRSLVEDRGVLLAPRFGFAYDVTGRSKTVISGGFGLYHNRMNTGDQYLDLGGQPPIVRTPVVYYGNIANVLSYSGAEFPQSVSGLDRNSPFPMVMNYSFTVRRAVGFGTAVDVAYVGSLGRHLMQRQSLSYIPAGTNFLTSSQDPTRPGSNLATVFLRQLTGYEDVSLREGSSSSNYHSLQLQANRRFARGLQYGASWTWSKALTYVDQDSTMVTPLVPWRSWYYGLAGFDRTHMVKLNWLLDLPKTPWRHSIAGRALNGWRLSGITTFASGAPATVSFSTATASDITGTPSQSARVYVTDNPVLPRGDRTFARNFRTDVFQPPARGTFGNAAKTLFRGPGTNNWNMALLKDVTVKDSIRMQVRCETSNTFNHTQFASWDTAARFDAQSRQINTRFGQAISARAPRVLQLAIRAEF
jgi:hypothetical protein